MDKKIPTIVLIIAGTVLVMAMIGNPLFATLYNGGECTNMGDFKCLTDSAYNMCLANGQWSGYLTCSSGTSCSDGSCRLREIQRWNSDPTKQCGWMDTKCGGRFGDNLYYCDTEGIWISRGQWSGYCGVDGGHGEKIFMDEINNPTHPPVTPIQDNSQIIQIGAIAAGAVALLLLFKK